MVAATGACAVLDDDPARSGTPASGEVPAISLDDRGCACGRCPADTGAGTDATSSTLAVVIRTSADRQVGRPGWVGIEQGALASTLTAVRTVTRTASADTWLAHSSPAAGGFAIELFLPLATGARVVIATERDTEAKQLLKLIRRQQVTHVQATPDTWRLLLDAGFDEPSVTAISVGTPPSSLTRRLHRKVRTWLSAYGQPETTLWSVAREFPAGAADATLGRPIPGTRAYIVAAGADMMPTGSIGELCLGGPAVARGYLGDPAATAERFAADPYGKPGARLFRTGHRARYRPEGDIEFLGAIHDSVLLRGHPIDLGRIEARLAANPGIDECVVAPDRDPDADSVTAYLVASPGEEPSPGELQTWLTQTLPRYMVPADYVTIDRFPLTADGGIDKEQLPGLANRAGSRRAEEKQPDADQDLQQEVAQIFRGIPRLKDIGLDDDIFSLGIDSLVVAQIITRIRLKLKVDIAWETFYEVPTIAGASAIIAHARRDIE